MEEIERESTGGGGERKRAWRRVGWREGRRLGFGAP